MDWTTIIVTLIGSGGIVGLFLITERKTAAALKNMQTMYDTLKRQYDDLLALYNKETDKVGKLYDKIGDLHVEKDAATTKAATSELKRCDNIFCKQRKPPMADRWCMDMEEVQIEKGLGNATDS